MNDHPHDPWTCGLDPDGGCADCRARDRALERRCLDDWLRKQGTRSLEETFGRNGAAAVREYVAGAITALVDDLPDIIKVVTDARRAG
jgi:hypothetical protein